jgi:hypothetical protein
MNLRHAGIAIVATLHLALVTAGAVGWSPPSGLGRAARTLDYYGAATGASHRFSYFAPGVASPLRAGFTLRDAAGRCWTDTLEEQANREAQLRIDSIVTNFMQAEFRPGLRRALAGSWAATMLGRHPQAERVLVRVEICDLPTMTQYRAGARPRWRPVYEAEFAR